MGRSIRALVFVAIGATTSARAQPLVALWTTVGDGGIDYTTVNALAIDVDGNALIGGRVALPARVGSFSVTGPSSGLDNLFLAKIDGTGNPLWAKSLGGGPQQAIVHGLTIDTRSGDIALTGLYEFDSDLFGAHLTGGDAPDNHNIFVARLSPDAASLRWVKTLVHSDRSDTGDELGSGVAIDNAGNVLATGSFRHNVIFAGTRLSSSYGDAYVARFSSGDGAPVGPIMRTSSSLGAVGYAVAALPDGGAIMAGAYTTWTDFGDGRPRSGVGRLDAAIAKYDSSGSLVFVSSLGGPGYSQVDDVAVSPGGDICVAGSFTGGAAHVTEGGDFELHTHTPSPIVPDGFVGCAGPDGRFRWLQAIDGSGYAFAPSVAIAPDGFAVVAGYFTGSATFADGMVLDGPAGVESGFVARFDVASGERRSLFSFGSADVVRARVDRAGDVFVAGGFGPNLRVGDRSFAAPSDRSPFYVTKLRVVTAPAEDAAESDNDVAHAAAITTDWTHIERCPPVRGVPSNPTDTCRGVFANGAAPKGKQEIWTQRVAGRTLTTTPDFSSTTLPDPGDSRWGPEHADIRAFPLVNDTPMPLPECSAVQRHELGPSGVDNTIYVAIGGKITAEIVPTEDWHRTGQGVRQSEGVTFYRDGAADRTLSTGPSYARSIACPRSEGLTSLVLSVGERATPRPIPEMGGYELHLTYEIDIVRGIPEWAALTADGAARRLGLIPNLIATGGGDVGRRFQLDFQHPLSPQLPPTCPVDGPGCPDFLVVRWPGADTPLELSVMATRQLSLRLLDATRKVVAQTPDQGERAQLKSAISAQGVSRGGSPLSLAQKTSTLVVRGLPADTYVLEVDGPRTAYSLVYQLVAPSKTGVPVSTPTKAARWRRIALVASILALVAGLAILGKMLTAGRRGRD